MIKTVKTFSGIRENAKFEKTKYYIDGRGERACETLHSDAIKFDRKISFARFITLLTALDIDEYSVDHKTVEDRYFCDETVYTMVIVNNLKFIFVDGILDTVYEIVDIKQELLEKYDILIK